MNPAKIGKMDEEVQKWSRKDPQAIKKAMVYPGKLLNYINYRPFPALKPSQTGRKDLTYSYVIYQ